MASKRIPTISSDRLNKEPVNTDLSTTIEDRKAKAFIKNREPTQATSLRLPESIWSKLRDLSFITRKSLNGHIIDAISFYLESDDVKITLETKRNRLKNKAKTS
jgi:macrodomain Ter protein organizer (MatP/YcbG family)